MFIIHAAAFPQLDVEYDNSTEDENEEKPGKEHTKNTTQKLHT